jgi:hypothetical protein
MAQIIYKNPHPMKTVKDITQEEFDLFVKYKAQYEWTNNDMMGVVNLSRMYVNPRTPSCLSCSNSFRETLNTLRSFYLNNKDEMERILLEKQNSNGTTKE